MASEQTADARVRAFCARYRFELIEDQEPWKAEDALGDRTIHPDYPPCAQLCAGRVIRVKPPLAERVYEITHEMAHQMAGFCDEKSVLSEQVQLLAGFAARLLRGKIR